MKTGNKVILLKAGNVRRPYVGTVTRQHNGHHITIEFKDNDDELWTIRARKTKSRGITKYSGWPTPVDHDDGTNWINLFCDWLLVMSYDDYIRAGYGHCLGED